MNSEPVRGTRLGSTSNESLDGVQFSPRQTIKYNCTNGHETELIFAAEVEIPDTWDCRKCGSVATREGAQVAAENTEAAPARTHFDLVLERRTREELEDILSEALSDLKKRREKEAS